MEERTRLAIRNDSHRAPPTSRARQLSMQSPRATPRPLLDLLKRGMPHPERDQKVVILVHQRFERRNLLGAIHAGVGEDAAG